MNVLTRRAALPAVCAGRGVAGVGGARAALRWPHLPASRVRPTAAYVALGALVVAVTV